MKETTWKPGEVAKELGVTGVTLRSYSKEFSQFLSPGAINPVSRHFTLADRKTLKIASSILRQGFTYEEVRQQLTESLPLEGEIFEGEPEEEPTQEAPSAIQPLEFFQMVVDQLREEHRSTLQAKDETIETLRQDKERLQAEVDFLHQPFFVRWFRSRKPPG